MSKVLGKKGKTRVSSTRNVALVTDRPPNIVRSVPNASTALGICVRNTWQLIKERKLGHVQLSAGRIGVTDEQIASYIAANSVKAIS
jgi:hypothetical protein